MTGHIIAAVLAVWVGVWTALVWTDSDAERIGDVENKLDTLVNLAILDTQRPFLEVAGPGIVVGDGPFEAGSTVPVQILLRRSKPCATKIEVRFAAAPTGAIDTSLTYIIDATRATISEGFAPFTARVRLPDNMRPGFYAYTPLIVPDATECPNDKSVQMISEYFEVIDGPEPL